MATKTKKTIEWLIFSFLGLIIVLFGSLFFYQVTYANKIYKNVYVADMDMSGKSRSQAAAILNKRFNDLLEQEITLKAGDKELKTKISDTGLVLDVNKIVSECYNAGRSSHFFYQLKNSAQTLRAKQNVAIATKIDQEKYDKFVQIAVAQFNTEPKNATLRVENGQIIEEQEQSGRVIDTGNLMDKILRLGSSDSDKTIALDSKNLEPQIKSADFTAAKSAAESILVKKIQFNYDNKTYVPSRSEIGNWITFSNETGKINVVLNDSNISAYLNKIAKDFEVVKKDKKINALDNSVIEEGQEGKLLDKNNVLQQIKTQIYSNGEIQVALKTYPVSIGEVKVFPAEGVVPGRFAGKYLDVDLTTQKLCEVENTNVLTCFTVSSGKPSMPTPTGTFYIQNKSPRAFSSKYGLWMPYWQAFNGPYGIHELPETNTWKEVPDHLGTPVSHGCVRLGVGPAEAVYNWTDIGTPVYIHK